MAPEFVAATAIAGWGLVTTASYSYSVRTAGTQPVTVATGVTVFRGAIGAALLGFAVHPPATAAGVALAWLPVTCFVLAGLLDAVDGLLARNRNAVSTFGERLDIEADGILVLTGAILVVSWGLAPLWVMLVGVARYVYLVAVWFRKQRGKAVGEDPARFLNRLSYAAMLSAIAIGLLPITGPELTRPLLAVVAALFLGNFLRDWFAKTGRF